MDLSDPPPRISRDRPDHALAFPHGATEEQRKALSGHLSAAGLGDPEGFRLVYSLTHRRLFRICLDICGHRQTAEDALADTYLSVFRRCELWDPARGSAMAWLSTIARNRAIDRLRCLTRAHFWELSEANDIPDLKPNSEQRLLDSERTSQLHRCIDRLSKPAQDALRLAFFEGCSYSELAHRAGVPLPTMKSTIRRALVRLSLDPELAAGRSC